jgi:hypothetical protein
LTRDPPLDSKCVMPPIRSVMPPIKRGMPPIRHGMQRSNTLCLPSNASLPALVQQKGMGHPGENYQAECLTRDPPLDSKCVMPPTQSVMPLIKRGMPPIRHGMHRTNTPCRPANACSPALFQTKGSDPRGRITRWSA